MPDVVRTRLQSLTLRVGTLATGRLNFALPMRAGHQYRIEVITGPIAGRLTIKGYESDLRGNKTREFERATSPKDIEACEEAAARSLRAPQ